MRQALKNFYNDIGRKKSYWLPVLFFAVLAYGFSMTNRTVSIDDLASDHYLGSGNVMLSATRWGMVLWVKILGSPVFTPFVKRFLAVCFLICGAAVFSCAAHYLTGRKNVWTYTVFSSILVTFPLFNEIYEYDVANVVVGGNLLLAALVILYRTTCGGGNRSARQVLIMALPLTLIVSSYEAGAFVYVTAVFIYLFLKYVIKGENSSRLRWIKDGMGFAIPLAAAIVLRILIGIFLIWAFGLQYAPNGATSIMWSRQSFLESIIHIAVVTANLYFLRALIYLPITIFAVSAIIFLVFAVILSIRQKRMLPVILGVAVLASLFLLSLVQGSSMAYRMAQTICLFSAFAVACAVELASKTKYNGIKITAIAAALFLCLHQSVYLSNILALNNQRSDNETAIVNQLGYRLKSEFPDKTVVFVGKYEGMGDWVTRQVTANTDNAAGLLYEKIMSHFGKGGIENRKIVDMNLEPVLDWASWAFGGQKMMGEYFSYCGYDIKVLQDYPEDMRKEYNRIAKEEGLHTFEIRDMGEYIFVCLGEIE